MDYFFIQCRPEVRPQGRRVHRPPAPEALVGPLVPCRHKALLRCRHLLLPNPLRREKSSPLQRAARPRLPPHLRHQRKQSHPLRHLKREKHRHNRHRQKTPLRRRRLRQRGRRRLRRLPLPQKRRSNFFACKYGQVSLTAVVRENAGNKSTLIGPVATKLQHECVNV